MSAAAPAPALRIIGIGQSLRGDDGLGPAVIERLRDAALPPAVELRTHGGETAGLIELWRGLPAVFVVDALRGVAPGLVHCFEVGAALPATVSRGSSHTLGLAAAVGLADALGERPATLRIYGLAGVDFRLGAGLSAPVRAQLDALCARILADAGAWCG